MKVLLFYLFFYFISIYKIRHRCSKMDWKSKKKHKFIKFIPCSFLMCLKAASVPASEVNETPPHLKTWLTQLSTDSSASTTTVCLTLVNASSRHCARWLTQTLPHTHTDTQRANTCCWRNTPFRPSYPCGWRTGPSWWSPLQTLKPGNRKHRGNIVRNCHTCSKYDFQNHSTNISHSMQSATT